MLIGNIDCSLIRVDLMLLIIEVLGSVVAKELDASF